MHQEDYVKLVDAFHKDNIKERQPEDFLNLFLEIVESK